MPRKIEFSQSFSRKAKKLLISNPLLKELFIEILNGLSENPFMPSLETHKLKGKLEDKYACSLTSNLRIIFKLSTNTIHLIDIGTHDEVY
ncbi:MAG: hypothetical protein C0392_05340 [Syntrophus sp. (in: bacteria)]|nr:hypothetical protein [Syntrophus sp. (in: bacteria)]